MWHCSSAPWRPAAPLAAASLRQCGGLARSCRCTRSPRRLTMGCFLPCFWPQHEPIASAASADETKPPCRDSHGLLGALAVAHVKRIEAEGFSAEGAPMPASLQPDAQMPGPLDVRPHPLLTPREITNPDRPDGCLGSRVGRCWSRQHQERAQGGQQGVDPAEESICPDSGPETPRLPTTEGPDEESTETSARRAPSHVQQHQAGKNGPGCLPSSHLSPAEPETEAGHGEQGGSAGRWA